MSPGVIAPSLEVLKELIPETGAGTPILVEAVVLSSDLRSQELVIHPKDFLDQVSQVNILRY